MHIMKIYGTDFQIFWTKDSYVCFHFIHQRFWSNLASAWLDFCHNREFGVCWACVLAQPFQFTLTLPPELALLLGLRTFPERWQGLSSIRCNAVPSAAVDLAATQRMLVPTEQLPSLGKMFTCRRALGLVLPLPTVLGDRSFTSWMCGQVGKFWGYGLRKQDLWSSINTLVSLVP